MSGHSHWATVKRKKGAEDEKRGRIFSKLSRMISVAAREGGDPEMNPKLKQALEEAKRFNMPKDNIEKAIKRGTGELEGEQLEEVMYEAIGPGGVNIILEGITDNKNRTLAEVKKILQSHNAKLADEGSIKWAFEQKGIILINPKSLPAGQAVEVQISKEELELKVIETGAEDMQWQKIEDEELLEITTSVESLEKVKESLRSQGVNIESSTLGWSAKEEAEVSEQERKKCEKLFEDLDENDAIQEIYSNLAS